MISMEQPLNDETQAVLRCMAYGGLSLYGDPSRGVRGVPFFFLPNGQRRDQVRGASPRAPSASCCVELHERGLIKQASEGQGGRAWFDLSNSGLALARTF